MRIHFIAIGGAVMHNLALTLHENGHQITGSDDEIYNPSRDRLAKYGLLPKAMGWYPEQISTEIDAIILGMHARKDNPELARAQALQLPIYSYPAYIYEHAKSKQRVVVAGSHGKTTTTSMILHVLRHHKINFDYLVGAQLDGFDLMARLSDAPIIVMEGDEYPASPIDLRPKIMHYRPHVAIITGIAWDHINVFPTFESYISQFDQFIDTIPTEGHLIYFEGDEHLKNIVAAKSNPPEHITCYEPFESRIQAHQTHLVTEQGQEIPLQVFGQHNLANLKAAYYACKAIGLSEEQFFEAIPTFKGAAKRLQLLRENKDFVAYLDFAHAPSKVEATIKAFKAQYPERPLTACLELHTFSSLNKNFLPQYRHTMNDADQAIVFYSPHTLEMKRLAPIEPAEVQAAFDHPNLRVITEPQHFKNILQDIRWFNQNLLLMSSGTFGGLDYKTFVAGLASNDE
ncbi:MAG: peptidoglycan synthetase [Saprospiraceae bacterium]|nr:peptidoglycan synthetase [Saprospiraceae bacterium]